MRSRCLPLLATLLLTACTPGPLAPAVAGAPERTAGAGPVVPGAVASAGPGFVGGTAIVPQVPAVVANNGAGLLGKVRAPSGLISDHGAGVVANNGGKLRLAALDQQPVAGAAVRLLDAAGRPVAGPDGRPFATTTDAQGGYAFPDAPADRSLVIAADVGGGTLQALAPRGTAARREADVELVSTLTTTYILERFVRPQADPGEALDRLPAAIEAETRTRAAAALAAGRAPTTLAPGQVLAAVEALRDQDAAFAAQLEAVRQLLVVAGADALGDGLPALDVYLGNIGRALHAPDGTIVLDANALWRLGKDGTLRREPDPGTWVGELSMDAQGRLWRGGYPAMKAWRREADGRLTEVSGGLPPVWRIVPTTGDGFLAFCAATYDAPLEVWERAGDGAPVRRCVLAGDAAELARAATVAVREAAGTLLLGQGGKFRSSRVGRLDPVTGALTIVRDAASYQEPCRLDAAGNIHARLADGMHLIRPDGRDTLVPGSPELPDGATDLEVVAPGPDGTYYYLGESGNVIMSYARSLFKLVDGRPVRVAGKAEQAVAAGSDPTTLTFLYPLDLAAWGDQLLVSDDGALLGIGPKGAETLLPKGALKDAGGSTLVPRAMQVDPTDDALYFLGEFREFPLFDKGQSLFRLRRGGQPERLWSGDQRTDGMVLAPGGTAYVAQSRRESLSAYFGSLVRVAPDGTATTIVPEAAGYAFWGKLDVDADGALLVEVGTEAGLRPYRWTEAAGLVALPADTVVGGVHDAQGRLVRVAQTPEGRPLIQRITRDARTREVLVGPGGRQGTEELTDVSAPCLDAQGNLYFVDGAARQIKRVPAAQL